MLFGANPEGARLAGRSNHEDAKGASVCLGRAAARRASWSINRHTDCQTACACYLQPSPARARSNSDDEIAAISHVLAVVATISASRKPGLSLLPSTAGCCSSAAAKSVSLAAACFSVHSPSLESQTSHASDWRLSVPASDGPSRFFFKECHFSLSSHTQSNVSRRSVCSRGTRSPRKCTCVQHSAAPAPPPPPPRKTRALLRRSLTMRLAFNAPAQSLRHGP